MRLLWKCYMHNTKDVLYVFLSAGFGGTSLSFLGLLSTNDIISKIE